MAFIAYTNHKPLTFCMSKVSEPWSGNQQRQLFNTHRETTLSKSTKEFEEVKTPLIEGSISSAYVKQPAIRVCQQALGLLFMRRDVFYAFV